jgi:hypothetical protein
VADVEGRYAGDVLTDVLRASSEDASTNAGKGPGAGNGAK